MYKKDGHTHTEFCPHGSGDDVEQMIQKAIQFGFKEYSVTEHAPLPPNFKKEYEGSDSGIDAAAMAMSDLPAYFKKIQKLQAKYRSQIKINLGFELDFLPNQLDWTRSFWAEYGVQTQDNVLSVHFLKGLHNHYWCVDNTPEEYQTGLLSPVQDAQVLYGQYIEALQLAVTTDLGPHAPKRLGHCTLIKKFQDKLQLPSQFNSVNLEKFQQLFTQIKENNFSLDLNTAGLYKPYCNETYPSPDLAKKACLMGIPMIYGSDAHSISAVGGGYHQITQFLN